MSVALKAPRFHSTRGAPGAGGVDAMEAILRGLAPDGGLYVPERVPSLPSHWNRADSFDELAVRALAPWFDDFEPLAPLVREALDFPLPLVPLSGDRFVLELFHGPTLSFKDVGARTMARLMGRALERRGRRVTILVATSGDTGSAVADGFAGQPNIDVVLLFPENMVSPLQERQLTAARPGVRALRVRGTFDDCQKLVKAAFVDPELRALNLSSANSINIGRLLPQSLYYAWGALQAWRQLGGEPPLQVVVPSGNLGNLTGGVLAWQAGLPLAGLWAAHNANDFFPEFVRGERPAFRFKATRATRSNAMDVGAPSNFERLHHLLGAELPRRVRAVSVDDDATLARMARSADEGYLPCPHTAVALEALDRARARGEADGPAMVLATAHPAKFPEVVEAATGRPGPRHPALEALRDAPRRVKPLEPDLDALRRVLLESDAGR